MDKKKEKAFDEKIKRFDRCFCGILVNVAVSILTTVFVYTQVLH